MEDQQQMQLDGSDMQDQSQILLFYVDENGGNEENVLTSVEQVESYEGMESIPGGMETIPEGEPMETEQTYYIEETAEDDDEPDEDLLAQYNPNEDPPWDEEEVKRLLVFYTDNKETFTSGLTKRRVLWSVACKTMLVGKTPVTCEMHLVILRNKYAQILMNHRNGSTITWPFIELAHQAFHDDLQVQAELADQADQTEDVQVTEELPETKVILEDLEILELPETPANDVTKVVNTFPCTQKKAVPADNKVVLMLQLYIKHSKRLKKFQRNYNHKALWETIVLEMREKDSDYWHHRFLNFKQHYIRILDRKMEKGDKAETTWPYMEYFNEIFLEDPDFKKKYITPAKTKHMLAVTPTTHTLKHVWNDSETTVLVKYYFDCYSEFQDRSIPDNFLWNEVGRLLDKNAALCHTKYVELRDNHLKYIFQEQYDLRKRKPFQILLDNIICKDVESEIEKTTVTSHHWSSGEEDTLVQLVHDNMAILKDPQGYYIVWAALGFKFNTKATSCLHKWARLRTEYKSILDDKKDNPENLIDWKYMDAFDRIFDYGMDTRLLTGYENLKPKKPANETNGKSPGTPSVNKSPTQDTRGYKPRSKLQDGEMKAFKILEYYQKHKDKFATSNRRKTAVWEGLAGKIGLTADQCAHRLRNLKQVFTGYVEKEITRSDLPIVWPYYQLCKKVFGYRAVKKKLQSKLADSEDEEWTPKEIKQLIQYFSDNFVTISTDDSKSRWIELALQLGKSDQSCRTKFVELRKSYRKLKTKITRNPATNITWKYYPLFDEIYGSDDGRGSLGELMLLDDEMEDEDEVADDEYQCIIVMPEGEELNINLHNPEPTPQPPEEEKKPTTTKWNKKSKKRLLTLYLKYVKTRKGLEISGKEMWKEIAGKLPNKTALSCRKMFAKLKTDRLNSTNEELHKNTPYYTLLEEIIKLKPKFKKVVKAKTSEKEYKDVPMPEETVKEALEFYLKNVEEFANPRFEKKYAWTDLAKAVNQPLNKIFNKINYLKSNDQSQYADLLKQISEREEAIRNDMGEIKKDDQNEEVIWSEDETEQLLVWYLANLDKFKNPKFVRRYLWIEAAGILNKSALSCSKQMSEIRTEYRTLVKEKPEELSSWRFNILCQKIYGTGKQKS